MSGCHQIIKSQSSKRYSNCLMSFPFIVPVDFHADALIIAILKNFTGNLICNDFNLLRFY